MAQKKDPTVKSPTGVEEYPEGTHPPHPPEEQTWGPGRFSYSDAPEELKPDKSSVVSQVEDPLTEEQESAQAEQAKGEK